MGPGGRRDAQGVADGRSSRDSRREARVTSAYGAPVSRTALVTGGTDGIGKEIARTLASESMRVVVVGSNLEKGRRAERDLRAQTGNDDVHFIQADLALLSDVDRFARLFAARWPSLHRLVLCAGMVRGRYSLTSEGIETNFALNYLGRFALTQALLPSLSAAGSAGAPARILVVGGASRGGRIHFENVNLTGRFNVLRMVSQFCAVNDLFVVQQARRIATARPMQHVTVTTLKVGVVRTNIRSQFPRWMKVVVPLLFDLFLSRSPQQIAGAARRLLVGPEFEGETGALFLFIRHFGKIPAGRRASDPALGRRLWEFSEKLIAQARGPLVSDGV